MNRLKSILESNRHTIEETNIQISRKYLQTIFEQLGECTRIESIEDFNDRKEAEQNLKLAVHIGFKNFVQEMLQTRLNPLSDIFAYKNLSHIKKV